MFLNLQDVLEHYNVISSSGWPTGKKAIS